MQHHSSPHLCTSRVFVYPGSHLAAMTSTTQRRYEHVCNASANQKDKKLVAGGDGVKFCAKLNIPSEFWCCVRCQFCPGQICGSGQIGIAVCHSVCLMMGDHPQTAPESETAHSGFNFYQFWLWHWAHTKKKRKKLSVFEINRKLESKKVEKTWRDNASLMSLSLDLIWLLDHECSESPL